MGSKERKAQLKMASATVSEWRTAQREALEGQRSLEWEEIIALADDLEQYATEIADDFDNSREALSDHQGLQDRWIENNEEKAEAWTALVSDTGDCADEEDEQPRRSDSPDAASFEREYQQWLIDALVALLDRWDETAEIGV